MPNRIGVNGKHWLIGALFLLLVTPVHAEASPVGETHRTIPLASAAQRRLDHKAEMDVTIWYPAAAGAIEKPDLIGPPGKPYFDIASFAMDARPAGGQHAVILLSHGFGGSAEIMGWLAAPFARAGYVVIGVDHPGNNRDDMSLPGAVAWWERPRDMIAALRAMEKDPEFGLLIDAKRIGAAGFSMGGMTALALGGAVVDQANYDDYCRQNSADLTCHPPPEMKGIPDVTLEQGVAMLGLQKAAAHAEDGTALPELRAILSIAPNSQALSPASLKRISVPTVLVAGSADPVVPPERHAALAAREVPGATIVIVPGAGHYSFLATCTPLGIARIGACKNAPAQAAAHAAAITEGLKLFNRTLRQ